MYEYGDEEYWNQRYREESGKTYDWLVTYEELKPVFEKWINHFGKGKRVLNVGCGNGILNEDMHDQLGCHVVNIDLSSQVVKQMLERNKQQRSSMQFEMMDAQKLSYESESFDGVIDKCTIDGIMCSTDYLVTAHRVIMEIFRVLKVGGMYLMISYSSSHNRKYLLERRSMAFSVTEQTIQRQSKQYYLYLCTKLKEYTPEMQSLNLEVEQQLKIELEAEKSKASSLLAPPKPVVSVVKPPPPSKIPAAAGQEFKLFDDQ